MTAFEKIVAVLNLIAVLLIPVVAVIVGQYLQERVQKRKDKMQIFQCLMTRRITGWAALEAINTINSIDIIFTDNKEIRNQLSVWKSKCRKDIPSEEQYREQCKLLELMANDLGYKDKITWDIIQMLSSLCGSGRTKKRPGSFPGLFGVLAVHCTPDGLPACA